MKIKEMEFWLTVNQRVAGSSPAGGATKKTYRNVSLFLFL